MLSMHAIIEEKYFHQAEMYAMKNFCDMLIDANFRQ